MKDISGNKSHNSWCSICGEWLDPVNRKQFKFCYKHRRYEYIKEEIQQRAIQRANMK